jgi:hypothetical protein
MEEEKVIFSEVQSISKIWGFILWPLALMPVLLLTWMYSILDFSRDLGLIIFVTLMFLSAAGFIAWLAYVSRLETKITESAIEVKYYPRHYFWHPVCLPWILIEKAEVSSYDAYLEMNERGYQCTVNNGEYYTISGSEGLRIVMKDGSKILIGTQDPDGMEAALQSRKNRIARGL